MSNFILPASIWTAIGLAGLSVLVMGLAGLRSVWYGKVQPLTIVIVSLPGLLVVVLRFVFAGGDTPWVQAGMFTLVIMFGLLILGMVLTGLRQLARSAFS